MADPETSPPEHLIRLPADRAARYVVAHLSDPHLLGAERQSRSRLDRDGLLRSALDTLERSGVELDALVVTGDLAEHAEHDAYRRLRTIVEAAAARMRSIVVWVIGNHDARRPYSAALFDEESDLPQNRLAMVRGLRIVALDSTIPGSGKGALTEGQLEWLREVLREPAPDGTLLALHHPPLRSHLPLMASVGLDHPDRLLAVADGTDVRGILAGHQHYASQGLLGRIPVAVATSLAFTHDLGRPGALGLLDGGRSIGLVHLYDDELVNSVLPIGDHTAFEWET